MSCAASESASADHGRPTAAPTSPRVPAAQRSSSSVTPTPAAASSPKRCCARCWRERGARRSHQRASRAASRRTRATARCVSLDARLVLRDEGIHLPPDSVATDLKTQPPPDRREADLILAMTDEQIAHAARRHCPRRPAKRSTRCKRFAGIAGDIEDPAGPATSRSSPPAATRSKSCLTRRSSGWPEASAHPTLIRRRVMRRRARHARQRARCRAVCRVRSTACVTRISSLEVTGRRRRGQRERHLDGLARAPAFSRQSGSRRRHARHRARHLRQPAHQADR